MARNLEENQSLPRKDGKIEDMTMNKEHSPSSTDRDGGRHGKKSGKEPQATNKR